MLQVEKLSIKLKKDKKTQYLLSNISFILKPGEVLGITGNSGSGKTSLIMALGGYLPFWSPSTTVDGLILLFDKTIEQGKADENVFVIIENPYNQITGLKSVAIEELVLPLEMRGYKRHSTKQLGQLMMKKVGLHKNMFYQLDWLSGGELQRLHLGSALISKPNLLLLDQAFTELDPAFRRELIGMLKQYAKEENAIVVISYSPAEIDEEGFDKVINLTKKNNRMKPEKQLLDKTKTPSNKENILTVQNLFFKYPNSSSWIFENLSFSLLNSEGMLLLGPNGSGKSTLAKILLGILKPQKGTISFPTTADNRLNTSQKINCAFQNPDLYFCKKTVKEELNFGLRESKADYSSTFIPKALGLLSLLELNPYDLSHGERKRLSIALAARSKPLILFLDEPTQYQDESGLNMVVTVILKLLEEGTSIICATHDERLLSLSNGFSQLNLQG